MYTGMCGMCGMVECARPGRTVERERGANVRLYAVYCIALCREGTTILKLD